MKNLKLLFVGMAVLSMALLTSCGGGAENEEEAKAKAEQMLKDMGIDEETVNEAIEQAEEAVEEAEEAVQEEAEAVEADAEEVTEETEAVEAEETAEEPAQGAATMQ